MSDVEMVRKRPGMYVGPMDEGTGLRNLVLAVVTLALAEARAGHVSEIEVVLHDDGSCSVRDNGRGLPTGLDAATDMSSIEAMFTSLMPPLAYATADSEVLGGVLGGLCPVNALSRWVEVRVSTTHEEHRVRFEDGSLADDITVTRTRVSEDRTPNYGTEIVFCPDARFFASVDFDRGCLAADLEALSTGNGGIAISLVDRRRQVGRQWR